MFQNDPDHSNTFKHVFRTLLITSSGAILALFILSAWMTRAVNDQAQSDARHLVATLLAEKQSAIRTLLTDYAYWDTAYTHVLTRDDEGVYWDMGEGVTSSGIFDLMLIYDGSETPIYGFEYEGDGNDTTLGDLALFDQLHAMIHGTPLLPYNARAGFVEYRGQIALGTVGRIQNYEDPENLPEELPLMIGLTIMSDEALTELGERFALHDLRISATAVEGGSAPLIAPDGSELSHLTWAPPTPGTTMFERSLWVISALSGVIIAGHIFVGWISLRQNQAYHRESLHARTDRLTRVLNRTGYDDFITSPQANQALKAERIALIYLDIDGLKPLNDTYGHDTGDAALQAMTTRLRGQLRRSDTLARLGGDEFVIVIEDDAPAEVATQFADRLNIIATDPVTLPGDLSVPLQASIGIAIAGPDDDWRSLLMRADADMYAVKRARKMARAA